MVLRALPRLGAARARREGEGEGGGGHAVGGGNGVVVSHRRADFLSFASVELLGGPAGKGRARRREASSGMAMDGKRE